MKEWVLIDRASGNVLSQRYEGGMPDREMTGASFWIERIRNSRPAYDPATHKLVPFVTQDDFTTISDVPLDAVRVEGFNAVSLTGQEVDAIKDADATSVIGDKALRALILALNDGSFSLNQSYSNAQLKAIIKAKL